MTFLNPFLLLGLAAAAIPIIIHLLNLRKLKTVEFSSLRFLKELQKTRMRRVKIKQWLLLALRTLMIIALVMAFSRPALRGSLAGTIGTHAKSTLIFLLDDSPSMSARNENGVVFGEAKNAILRVMNLMKEGDEAYLVKLSDVNRTENYPPLRSADDLRKAFESLVPSHERVPYREAFGVAAKLLAASKNFNQEIYLFTDGQATQFDMENSADSTDLFGDGVKVFVSELTPTSQSNAGVSSVNVQSRILAKDKPVSLSVTVRNFGSTALTNSIMSVYLDGVRVVQQSLDIAAGGSASPILSIIPKRRGSISGYVQLEDDAIEIDNRRYFSLTVPENLNILLAGATQQETRLPLIALTLDKDSINTGLLRTQSVTESQLSSIDIMKFDVVLLSGVVDFSPTEAERIDQFVKAGGGLVIFPGKDANIASYNETLFKRLEIPQAQSVLNDQAPSQNRESYLSFGAIDFVHPLFEGLFEQTLQQKQGYPVVESPHVYSFITTHPGVKGHTIISLSSGSGFLTEYPHGTGRVLLFAVEAGLTGSDFPVKGLFVPLIYRSVLYLSSRNETASPFVVGDEIKAGIRLKERGRHEVFILRTPSGVDERVVPVFSMNTGLANFSTARSTEAGIYEIRTGGAQSSRDNSNTLQIVAVNVDPLESGTRQVSAEEINLFWRNMGLSTGQITQLPDNDNIDVTIQQSRFGVELWKYFVILALACALTEMIISRESKPEAAAA